MPSFTLTNQAKADLVEISRLVPRTSYAAPCGFKSGSTVKRWPHVCNNEPRAIITLEAILLDETFVNPNGILWKTDYEQIILGGSRD